jgi:hypothetical protein
MSKQQLPLDPLIEGYLDYLADVGRRKWTTLRDVRCTLRRTSAALAVLAPGVPLWKLKLTDYLRWLEQERSQRRRPTGLQKKLSHLRCFLTMPGGQARRAERAGQVPAAGQAAACRSR